MNKDIDLTAIVGLNIAKRRKQLELNQRELAAKLDITDNAIVRMEKGLIAPKMSRIQELADALDCTVTSLFISDNEQIEEDMLFIAREIKNYSPEAKQEILNIIKSAIKFANIKNI